MTLTNYSRRVPKHAGPLSPPHRAVVRIYEQMQLQEGAGFPSRVAHIVSLSRLPNKIVANKFRGDGTRILRG